MAKIRIDKLIAEKELTRSRSEAIDLIKRGKVSYLANGVENVATKAGEMVNDDVSIIIKEPSQYVGRGGIKLAHALKKFSIHAKDRICLDIGSSTGGFTDCLIQNEAKHVYAVDVGTNQFNKELAKNPKITLLENTDIRSLQNLPERVSLIVVDVSFISLDKIIPLLGKFIPNEGESKNDIDIILLFKPQFEVGQKNLDRNGIVKNEEAKKEALQKIIDLAKNHGYRTIDRIDSPIEGGSGNSEFLIHLKI